jgi:hypothetical protein
MLSCRPPPLPLARRARAAALQAMAFRQGSTVLAHFGDLIYPAKILKARPLGGGGALQGPHLPGRRPAHWGVPVWLAVIFAHAQPRPRVQAVTNGVEYRYFIHYNGWNASFDEWVVQDR